MLEPGPQAWFKSGSMFAFRGRRIFWRHGGRPDRPVLLLIHGFPTSSWDWSPVWPLLEGHYRLVAADMLGFGFSDKPHPHAYSLFEQADIHEELLRQLGVGEYHVLAHDYGDTVAQELVARAREPAPRAQLRSVCFLNGGLFPETHRLLAIQKLLLSPLGPLVARMSGRRRLAAGMRRIFGPGTQPDDKLIDAFRDLMARGNGLRVLPGLIRYIPERIRHRERWVGALAETSIPLKLVDGAADPVSGAHMAQRYREQVPRADVTELPAIGHYPQIEAPGPVVDAYLAFRTTIDC